MAPPKTEWQLEQDITEAEEWWCGLQTQLISNSDGRVIPPLTRASHRELLTPLQSPLLESQPLTEIAAEPTGTKRTLTPLSTTVGSEERDSANSTSQHTSKKEGLDISITSSPLAEEQDLFERLLTALKNSSRPKKQPQIEKMAEDKKPLESRPKVEPEMEEARISTTVPVQVVAAEKEVKVALPRAFTGQ
ncbi:hypothetical protein Moror_2249 [Moniliophthora roreri MCA 2997]|uniref:Uncharacterized protein n=1 Tax=Moniliophthora roreri (strain MCA 2997) TaxID=1381753 RepID=V2WL53_MONRO|nr:hypothetical protein Moror_2249 [Moniliophthora roreri MCA 2997]